MDDRLNNLHRLTFRSRLHHVWHRCFLYLTGVRYTAKLLHFTYRNVLVLRHFQRCREVEAAVTQSKKTRFPYLDFYKHTWQQSRKLFTPLRGSSTLEQSSNILVKNQPQPILYTADIEPVPSWSHVSSPVWMDAHTAVLSVETYQRQRSISISAAGSYEEDGDLALQTVTIPKARRSNLSLSDSSLFQREDLPSRVRVHACPQHAHTAAAKKQKPRRFRIALQKMVLSLWYAPRFLMWKLGTFFRTRIFKVKLRSLYQQQQIELLRERQRILSSTQTALFLSLANTIDLQTTRELATLCQHVSRARRKRKMTEEDFACFDQSVTELDKNHDSLQHAA